LVSKIAGFLGVISAIMTISFLGLLSLVLPKTADNYLERIKRWAEDEKSC
jgi:hypothetical protein